MSIDPVTTDANTGGSFNRYAYANNSPYKYIDPDGRNAFLVAAAVVTRVAGPRAGTAVLTRAPGAAVTAGEITMGDALGMSGVTASLGPAGPAVLQGAEEVGKMLFRRGASDSKALLTNSAKEAESRIGFHGVSTSTSPKPNPNNPTQTVRSSTFETLTDAGITVEKTGKDPNHYTAVIPSPVTSEFTKLWNSLWE